MNIPYMPCTLPVSEHLLASEKKHEANQQVEDPKQTDSVGSCEEQQEQTEPERILKDKHLQGSRIHRIESKFYTESLAEYFVMQSGFTFGRGGWGRFSGLGRHSPTESWTTSLRV